MAIQKNVTAVDMKTVLNYGEQPDGRIMKRPRPMEMSRQTSPTRHS